MKTRIVILTMVLTSAAWGGFVFLRSSEGLQPQESPSKESVLDVLELPDDPIEFDVPAFSSEHRFTNNHEDVYLSMRVIKVDGCKYLAYNTKEMRILHLESCDNIHPNK